MVVPGVADVHGEPSAEVLGARPGLGQGTSTAVLGVHPAEYPLLVGDRAVLFLLAGESAELGPVFGVQAWNGMRVVGGRVRPQEWCEFGDDVAGETAGTVLDRVRHYAGV